MLGCSKQLLLQTGQKICCIFKALLDGIKLGGAFLQTIPRNQRKLRCFASGETHQGYVNHHRSG